ncbi:MAG: L-aspartate oxidase [Acidobacteriota bacterium]|nr:L-aspartate oxidase [Acidobacteriota bacterium]
MSAHRFGSSSGARFDAIIVGTGVAGLAAAVALAPRRVALLTKSRFATGGSSNWAQGGIAAAVGTDDAPALHAADTLAAGAGLNDPEVVALLTEEGPRRIAQLLDLGAHFDRAAGGALSLGREAAHSRRRILHAGGDATGAELVRTLSEAVRREPAVRVFEETFALDLWIEDGVVAGLAALGPDGRRRLFLAPAVVLATGGLGRLYLHTTNPPEATGDGLAMAVRAGAEVVDVEFVQFHPTALAGGADPMPLLTEALRGEGAILVDRNGARFMLGVHPDAELAPRDVVARAIWRRLSTGDRVYLDATRAVGERFPERFPTVFRLCQEHGFDPRTEPIPVSPAAHYHMGGIAVDGSGRTTLPGLWACGEAAATGAHGANRLASNSLLEALVFGGRVAEDLAGAPLQQRRRPARLPTDLGSADPVEDARFQAEQAALATAVRTLMWEKVGVVRDGQGLTEAVAALDRLAESHPNAAGEARNLLWAGRLVAAAALARRESRGGHYRSDYPEADPAWQRHLALTAAPDGEIRIQSRPLPSHAPAPLALAAGSSR